jgi:RecA-family ATPase
MIDQQLPASEFAERSVIGSLLYTGNMGLAEALTIEHFHVDSHRKIFRLMNELHADGFAVDLPTVIDHLVSRKILESVGGPSYVSELTTGCVPESVHSHVKILHEKKQLREIIRNASNAIARAYNQQDKPVEILSELNTASVSIAADTHVKDQDILLDVSKFIRQYNQEVEWRVDGAIEIGTNGMMFGMSGDGKSPAARALAVCLASGLPWLDLRVKRCRTALISREDYAGTTSRFIKRFIEGNGLDEQRLNLASWLWISSRAQVPSLLLDNPSDLRLLINNLKRKEIQFCILDVLNVLHSKDENDNTDMRKVLAAIDHIRDEVGCQVMVLHHSRKGVDASTAIAEAGRGSSAMAGFAEFKMLIRTEDEDAGIKQIRFKTKAGEGQKSFYWAITDLLNGGVSLERRDYQPKQQPTRRQMAM